MFAGAISALALMTVLSGMFLCFASPKSLACLGWITQLIPHKFTFYISTALFAFFGIKMLHEGYYMSPNESQEGYEEAQAEVSRTNAGLESGKYSELEAGGVAER